MIKNSVLDLSEDLLLRAVGLQVLRQAGWVVPAIGLPVHIRRQNLGLKMLQLAYGFYARCLPS